MNNMLTLEEVKAYLEVEQKDLENYLAQGRLHAYKIGGTYIRFRKEDVQNLRFNIGQRNPRVPGPKSVFAHIYDFWRFNNFYIVSIIIAIAIIYWWVSSL